jgi:hypothetical protein
LASLIQNSAHTLSRRPASSGQCVAALASPERSVILIFERPRVLTNS